MSSDEDVAYIRRAVLQQWWHEERAIDALARAGWGYSRRERRSLVRRWISERDVVYGFGKDTVA